MTNKKINIIGAGLAGVEIALFFAKRKINVVLYEMKSKKRTDAQTSDNFAELVCSNSFRGTTNAVGELKLELKMLNSTLMEVAERTKVPAGNALAVDRDLFSEELTKEVKENEYITIIEEEFSEINNNEITIIATGPLTSKNLIAELSKKIDIGELHFYDAIAPIIDASTIDYDIVFEASRWQKEGETSDYLNCPMDKEQYEAFVDAMSNAERVPLHSFEKYFEGCLPIEVMQERSHEQLRFGPLKPVGLFDPRYPGKRYHAVVQLRTENREKTYYNIVGFQTKLTYKEQKNVFSKIPGLENAKFERYGSIHRNTFIDAPKVLENNLSVKGYPNLYITGQLGGVEGYVESIAMGMMTAISIYKRLIQEKENANLDIKENMLKFPGDTAMGALYNHLFNASKVFQPSNVNFSLFASIDIPRKTKKRDRKRLRFENANRSFANWVESTYIINEV